MPRGSASAKRQQGASASRDTKHENGVVGPGKRVSKQKSQGQLGGPAKTADGNADIPQVPSTPISPPSAQCINGHSKPNNSEMPPAEHKTTESLRRASIGGYSESSSSAAESFQVPSVTTTAATSDHDNHRRIDVNATKNSNVHKDTGPLDFAMTVLRSCPLQDTIAILIILMQIPPIALSGIYMLFTLLTFVTTSNGLTLSDVFEWNLGAPSLATVVCVDGIVLLIWLFLWGPIQHVILDLAQMVIALGLGGGSTSRDGSAKNSLICLSMILLSHTLRHMKVRVSPAAWAFGKAHLWERLQLDDPLDTIDSLRGYDRVASGWLSWVRSILAIHILTQGLVKWVRDWYLRRERRDNLALSAADPEAGKTYPGDNEGGFLTPDSDPVNVQNQTPINTKKKRKQSAQIRNRQPLWAALASTKIVVVKEYELTQAAAESAGSNATDIHNLGNAPFNTEPGQIWISYVGCDEVCFNTSHFPPNKAMASTTEDAKPFYVRVNNAEWQPTRTTAVESPEDDHGAGTRWSGDIYGLTPLSNYECEFVDTDTHEVIFSTSVRTTQAKSADIDVAASKPAPQRMLRPDSPITTLKNSIAAAESKLTEEKSRQKAVRREYQRKSNALKKENEKLSAAVLSAGTGDDKLRQKIQQNQTQQKQAEQATASLEGELKEFDKIPESLKSAWKSKQNVWNNEKAKYDGAVAAFKSFKTSVESGLKALDEEKAALEAKRNKISGRISKVDSEHERIADANARGLDEAERRRQERESFQADIARMEREMVNRINANEALIFKQDQENLALRNQLESFNQAYSFASSYEFPESGGHFSPNGPMPPHPPTSAPDSQGFDHSAAWSQSLYHNSLWGPSPLAPAFTPQSAFMPHTAMNNRHVPPVKSRGRSSSMLSNVSGFTQSSATDDENNTPFRGTMPGHAGAGFYGFRQYGHIAGDRGNAIGSDTGSSSASPGGSDGSVGSGSMRDSMSPPPA
ncbi:ubiquitination network signaling protein AcrB [Microdochium nivale]|nr:ubiquitination network signaling protein AcrB [Microdochium nivale]